MRADLAGMVSEVCDPWVSQVVMEPFLLAVNDGTRERGTLALR